MIITFNKKPIFFLLTISILLSTSCTNLKQKELASADIIKSAENPIVKGEYRYIINKRTGKIHTYNHGIEIIKNKGNVVGTNDSLETILQDESKDLCRTCWAGIKTNLSSYDDNKLDLIEKFMRLYEFSEIDVETQKFLMCIFEVGEWYVDNVYTYQGGKQTVVETDNIAKELASVSAHNRWQNYLTTYSKLHTSNNESKILPVVFDNNNKPTSLVTYKCDLFKKLNYGYGDNKYSKSQKQTLKNADNIIIDQEWKNYCVVDDCSKFAAAVYYHYINKELLKNKLMGDKTGYDIDLWSTSSIMFSNENSFTSKLSKTKEFILHKLSKSSSINNNSIDNTEYSKLQIGDLIYRNGHVEFYIGYNKVIGWGRIHNSYTLHKSFNYSNGFFYSNDPKDNNIPYTTIIRFRGGDNKE